MLTELQDKLITTYPSQFENLKYIECNDGWYDLINKMCDNIQRHIDHDKKYKNSIIPFNWSQIKEKFGCLRAYFYGGDDRIFGIVEMAESMSSSICEFSGEKGKLRYKKLHNNQIVNAWIKCLSDDVAEKEGYVDQLIYGE